MVHWTSRLSTLYNLLSHAPVSAVAATALVLGVVGVVSTDRSRLLFGIRRRFDHLTLFFGRDPPTPSDVSLRVPPLPASLAEVDARCKVFEYRPARHGGPRLEVEALAPFLLAHNYGHSGGGWSTGIGCVLHVIDELLLIHPRMVNRLHAKIVVVGAGVMGLFTALTLWERGFRNIHIIADKVEDTASTRAGGLIAPVKMGIDQGNRRLRQVMRKAESATLDFFRDRALNNLPGGRFVPVYFDRQDAHELDRPPYVPAITSDDVVGHFGANVSRPLRRYIGNVFMDGPLLLAEWQTQLMERGITITRINEQYGPLPPYADASFTSTLARYNIDAPNVVMNCAGYGARYLCGDKEVYRLVGHLIMLQKPEYQRHHNYVLSDYISDDPTRAVYYHCREHDRGYGMIGGTFIPVREGEQGPNGEDIDDRTGLPIDNQAEWMGVLRRFTTYVTRPER